MPRAKRGFKARRRRNRILKHASGFHSARSRLFAYAKEVVMKSWVYAYAHRRRKKRDFRRLWIARINAAARKNGTTYSRLMHALEEGEHRARSQGPRGPRHRRREDLRRDRRQPQVGGV